MNFGHTFGHALESTSNYRIPHGQAVSCGMLIANRISYKRGYISKEILDDFVHSIWKIITPELLKVEFFSEKRYLNAMKKDKKFKGTFHTCILFQGDGVKKHSDITDGEVLEAIEHSFFEEK